MSNILPTSYQQYIHISRYSRWREELGRRETWEETIDRLMSFWGNRLKGKVKNTDIEEIRESILALKVMPSMRSVMTAGPALNRDEVAGYNCSFTVIDHPRCFDEIMYILMCGTGMGFSVERQYVSKLPEVAEEFHESETTIVVSDSKLGWASSLRELISLLYSGKIPKWDVSKIRPAGAKLKTFGGRASGPKPLDDLFRFCVEVFRKAKGRKLNSIECHDLVCKIAEIVVVGGVRRSALISLSNLSDDRMRNAKSGQWWVDHPHRALANNSYVADEKPSFQVFLDEWFSLYESKSGERGIFSITAAKKKAEESGRRDGTLVAGTNPCLVDSTWISTVDGPRMIKDLIDTPFKALVEGESRDCNTGFFKTGDKQTYKLTTKKGYELTLTDNHPLLKVTYKTRKKETTEWVEVKDLSCGDKIKLSNQKEARWDGKGNFQEGYLLGQLVGDGGFSYPKSTNKNTSGYVRFYTDEDKEIAPLCLDYIKENLNHRSDVKVVTNGKYDQVMTTSLYSLANEFGISDDKSLGEALEKTSYEFYSGFLSGFFDADGTISTNKTKGRCARYSQSNVERLKVVQRMLSRMGIVSTIYPNRRRAGQYYLPDGKGGEKFYYCKELFELVISNDNLQRFSNVVEFKNKSKAEKIKEVVSTYKRTPNKEQFIDEIVSIQKDDVMSVYDCTIEDVHEFDANGIRVHNCSEILLRDKQMCNLSEVVIKPNDSLEDLKNKVRVATILGTFQSTLTDFRYLRKKWKDNCEEERLLGVSLTGISDHPVLRAPSDKAEEWLRDMKQVAIDVNEEWAKKLKINQSAAITCVKPSGTVSQLVDSASGIHPRFSEYYIRRVRNDKKDPLSQFLIDSGFPYEQDVMNSESYVFSFPMKSPKTATVADDMTAMDQLKLWKMYADVWCEHKPSMTAYYRDDDFLAVGNWLWNNFDDVSGVSFLPYSDHTYQQAPYEEVTKEKYDELVREIPNDIDWLKLQEYEQEDMTTGSQEYACAAGGCEI